MAFEEIQIMKLCLFLFVILTCSIGITGQRKTAIKRPLNANTGSIYSGLPFDINLKSLPRRFEGNDAAELFQGLNHLASQWECGKFERSEECQNRRDALSDSFLSPIIKASDMLAFSIEIDDCDYSADEETMTCPGQRMQVLNWNSSFTWKRTLIDSGSYIGSTTFGVKKRVTYKNFLNYHINYLATGFREFNVKNIAPDLARKIIPNMRLLIIGIPVSPWVKREFAAYDATIDNPTATKGDNRTLILYTRDIWLYDYQSGKIYSKHLYKTNLDVIN